MKNYWQILGALSVLVCASARLSSQDRIIPITPKPQEVAFSDQTFVINRDTEIVLGLGTTEFEALPATIVNSQIEHRLGFKLKVRRVETASQPPNTIYLGNLTAADSTELPFGDRIDLDVRVKIGDQGYFLQVSDRLVLILARTSQGLYYGVQSLSQLMVPKEQSVEIPGVK
ncbi:glycoside hydrolase family 20 zincin-like fold domain-containing protein, partial [bacterium]|nr:glycoside hydrolase family 20 zincin-like fold domain-containing protein [bacterium]